jgi:soluble lytic murein transglycosylase-like protein
MANLWTRGICVVVVCALAAPLARAEVKIMVGKEGRKVIFNENLAQRTRRFASRLVAVPDSDLEPLITRRAQEQNLDPKLVRALIQAESGYNVRALSNKGAIGLMQLMPATASLLNVQNPYDADENLRGGTAYLRQLIDRFAGRLELAVAAYNAGPGAVTKHRGVPPYQETREYVRRVLALYRDGDPHVTASRVAAAAPAFVPAPRKPYVTRNSDNQLVITTALGGQR